MIKPEDITLLNETENKAIEDIEKVIDDGLRSTRGKFALEMFHELNGKKDAFDARVWVEVARRYLGEGWSVTFASGKLVVDHPATLLNNTRSQF